MSIPSTGEISFEMLNIEMKKDPKSSISLDDEDVRWMAIKEDVDSEISFSDLYEAVWIPKNYNECDVVGYYGSTSNGKTVGLTPDGDNISLSINVNENFLPSGLVCHPDLKSLLIKCYKVSNRHMFRRISQSNASVNLIMTVNEQDPVPIFKNIDFYNLNITFFNSIPNLFLSDIKFSGKPNSSSDKVVFINLSFTNGSGDLTIGDNILNNVVKSGDFIPSLVINGVYKGKYENVTIGDYFCKNSNILSVDIYCDTSNLVIGDYFCCNSSVKKFYLSYNDSVKVGNFFLNGSSITTIEELLNSSTGKIVLSSYTFAGINNLQCISSSFGQSREVVVPSDIFHNIKSLTYFNPYCKYKLKIYNSLPRINVIQVGDLPLFEDVLIECERIVCTNNDGIFPERLFQNSFVRCDFFYPNFINYSRVSEYLFSGMKTYEIEILKNKYNELYNELINDRNSRVNISAPGEDLDFRSYLYCHEGISLASMFTPEIFYFYRSECETIGDHSFESLDIFSFYFSRWVTSLFRGSQVVNIGDYVFSNCKNLTLINMMFLDCSKLQTIGDYMYKGCDRLGFFGEKYDDVGYDDWNNYSCTNQAFCNCTSLSKIGHGMFEDCISLTTLSVDFQPSWAMEYRVFYGNNVLSIGDKMFSGCIKLTDLNISYFFPHLIQIGDYTFNNCISLENSDGTFYGLDLVNAPGYTYNDCINLKTANNLFEGCKKLNYGNSTTFNGCTSLTSVKNLHKNNSSLIEVPYGIFDNLTSLEDVSESFYGCTSLTEINNGLFNNLESLKKVSGLFMGCTNIVSVDEDLFKTCVNISDFSNCFNGCSSITSKIPEVWITHPDAIGTGYAAGCINASNYSEIPEGWK